MCQYFTLVYNGLSWTNLTWFSISFSFKLFNFLWKCFDHLAAMPIIIIYSIMVYKFNLVYHQLNSSFNFVKFISTMNCHTVWIFNLIFNVEIINYIRSCSLEVHRIVSIRTFNSLKNTFSQLQEAYKPKWNIIIKCQNETKQVFFCQNAKLSLRGNNALVLEWKRIKHGFQTKDYSDFVRRLWLQSSSVYTRTHAHKRLNA